MHKSRLQQLFFLNGSVCKIPPSSVAGVESHKVKDYRINLNFKVPLDPSYCHACVSWERQLQKAKVAPTFPVQGPGTTELLLADRPGLTQQAGQSHPAQGQTQITPAEFSEVPLSQIQHCTGLFSPGSFWIKQLAALLRQAECEQCKGKHKKFIMCLNSL